MSNERDAQQSATGRNNHAFSKPPLERFLSRRQDLTQRQQAAVELLLRGHSDQETAAQLGVDRGTIFRWRKSIAFARELDRQRQLRFERAAHQMQSMVPTALAILQKQLESGDPRQSMRAASILLRFATPGRLGTTNTADSLGGAAVSEKSAHAQEKEHVDDLIAYIEAPLPGQPGCPEEMSDDPEDSEDLDE
jgi:DNA-binding CsgD family transcriptional regulator